MKDNKLIEEISKVSKGMFWYSESEYPFETVCFKNVEDLDLKLREVTNCSPETKIEVKELEEFFDQATKEEDWYNEEEMAQCKRYQELVSFLQANFPDIKVYCVGEIEINCYILGKIESGAFAGLSTISVETT